MVERNTLFQTDVYKTQATHHSMIKKYMMDTVYPHFLKNGPNDVMQNQYTDYMPGAVSWNWQYIASLYKKDIAKMLEAIGFNLQLPWQILIRPWYNFTTYNTKEFVHDHTGGPSTINFAAVHYVHFDDTCEGTVFLNPNGKEIKASLPTKNRDYLPRYFLEYKRSIPTSEGDLVMFPSWLDHHVPPHTSNSLRVVIAMNIMLRIDDMDGL